MNPSPSAQNPISQPLKKANPSSYFTPSRPSSFGSLFVHDLTLSDIFGITNSFFFLQQKENNPDDTYH